MVKDVRASVLFGVIERVNPMVIVMGDELMLQVNHYMQQSNTPG